MTRFTTSAQAQHSKLIKYAGGFAQMQGEHGNEQMAAQTSGKGGYEYQYGGNNYAGQANGEAYSLELVHPLDADGGYRPVGGPMSTNYTHKDV